VGSVLFSGLFLSVYTINKADFSQGDWLVFLLVTGLATAAQLFKSEAPAYQLYHPALIFFFTGVLSLEPGWFAGMVVITHLVEWAKEALVKSRHLRAWYIQPFNIAMHVLVGFAARNVFLFVNPDGTSFTTLQAMGAAVLAALVYVLLNHLIVGQALMLARGVSWRESGILEIENLSTDFVMLSMGYVVTVLMTINPWLFLPALTPIYLVYRALAVPRLKREVNTDSKTGLWNAEYYIKAVENELLRARRYGRPLTVVIADLDFLRNINNAFGHLAGDEVLKNVARILKKFFREYDVVARFGGEEFAVLLPETTPLEAYPRVEAVRRAVSGTRFESPITGAVIRTTMSFGIADNSNPAYSVREIIHCADIAVYQAKLAGRNRTRIYTAGEASSLGVFDHNEVDAVRNS
jgi:diguanylate cyclase (GGDEF)-like protein